MKVYSRGRGGVELHVKSDGDARGKIKIKPLREANVGVVLAQADPYRRQY